MAGLSFKIVLCKSDYILITLETVDEHICDLHDVFDRLQKTGLKLSSQKCKFSQRKCILLGHEISTEGFKPPNDGLESISEYPLQKNVKAFLRAHELVQKVYSSVQCSR